MSLQCEGNGEVSIWSETAPGGDSCRRLAREGVTVLIEDVRVFDCGRRMDPLAPLQGNVARRAWPGPVAAAAIHVDWRDIAKSLRDVDVTGKNGTALRSCCH